MPYDLCIYNVTHKSKTALVELERVHVDNAARNTELQKRIAMAVRDALGVKWVDYKDLTIELVKKSSTPSGCSCDCFACDDMTQHCRRDAKSCYI